MSQIEDGLIKNKIETTKYRKLKNKQIFPITSKNNFINAQII